MDPAKLKVVELRAELSSRGLDTKGNKPVLVKRLKEALESESGNDLPDTSIADTSTEDLDSSQTQETSSESSKVTGKEHSSPSKAKSSPEKHSPREKKPEAEKDSEEEEEDDVEMAEEASENMEQEEKMESEAAENENDTEMTEEKIDEAGDKDAGESKNRKSRWGASQKKTEDDEAQPDANDEKKEDEKKEVKRGEKRKHDASGEEEKHGEKRRHEHKSPDRTTRKRSKTPVKEDEPEINAENVLLSWVDSDLHLCIDKETFLSAQVHSNPHFGYLHSGVRATHGINTGKVYYEVKYTENLKWEEPVKGKDKKKDDKKQDQRRGDRKYNGSKRDEKPSEKKEKKETEKKDTEKKESEKKESEKKESENKDTEKKDTEKTESENDPKTEDNKMEVTEETKKTDETKVEENKTEDNKTEEVKPEDKTEEKTEVKTEVKTEEKTDDKTEEKTEEKTDDKTDDKTEEKSEEKTEEEKVEKDVKEENDEEKTKTEENAEPVEEKKPEEPEKPEPTHTLRIGWSALSANLQLGESPMSYGFDSDGYKVLNSTFEDVESKFTVGDVVGCYLDLTSDPVLIKYSINGQMQDFEISIPRSELPEETVMFPHILTRNVKFEANFGQQDPWFPVPEDFSEYLIIKNVENKVEGLKRPEKRQDCQVIMMVGLPCCGKTTWVNKHIEENLDKRYTVLGTTQILEKMKYRGTLRKNQKGSFHYDMAAKCMNKLIDLASLRRRNFILDQTNLFSSAQRRKMRQFEGFHRRAVIVVVPDDVQATREKQRHEADGKDIPDSAILEMKANFTIPEIGEWLAEITYPELEEKEAKEAVAKYNKQGKDAGYGPNFSHKKNNDGYKRQWGRNKNFKNDGRNNRWGPRGDRDRDRDSRWGGQRQGGWGRHEGRGGRPGGWWSNDNRSQGRSQGRDSYRDNKVAHRGRSQDGKMGGRKSWEGGGRQGGSWQGSYQGGGSWQGQGSGSSGNWSGGQQWKSYGQGQGGYNQGGYGQGYGQYGNQQYANWNYYNQYAQGWGNSQK